MVGLIKKIKKFQSAFITFETENNLQSKDERNIKNLIFGIENNQKVDPSIKMPGYQNISVEENASEQFKVPITYAWFGQREFPIGYMLELSAITYPIYFFKNPLITRSFNRQLNEIQKADYFRLQYLYQNGGIYSDLSNKIDYQCLMRVLKLYTHQDKIIFWWKPKRNLENQDLVPNNFIYAPKPKMQTMKVILEEVSEENDDLEFAGRKYLSKFANKQLIQVKSLYNCIKYEDVFPQKQQNLSSQSLSPQIAPSSAWTENKIERPFEVSTIEITAELELLIFGFVLLFIISIVRIIVRRKKNQIKRFIKLEKNISLLTRKSLRFSQKFKEKRKINYSPKTNSIQGERIENKNAEIKVVFDEENEESRIFNAKD